MLADPDLRPLVIADLTEAVIRPGARGLADELALYAGPWGFPLEEITATVHMWHGDSDVSAPTALARGIAAAIPGSRAVFVPGGHTAPFAHFDDILKPVRETARPAPGRGANQ